MPSYIRLTLEKIHQLRTEADVLQQNLNDDIEAMIAEGLVANVSDEDPTKAVGKYVQALINGAQISAANVKSSVACTRDLTHRAITAMLSWSPLLSKVEEKDSFGLTQFQRVDPNAAISLAAE
jgi:hypothetical protein